MGVTGGDRLLLVVWVSSTAGERKLRESKPAAKSRSLKQVSVSLIQGRRSQDHHEISEILDSIPKFCVGFVLHVSRGFLSRSCLTQSKNIHLGSLETLKCPLRTDQCRFPTRSCSQHVFFPPSSLGRLYRIYRHCPLWPVDGAWLSVSRTYIQTVTFNISLHSTVKYSKGNSNVIFKQMILDQKGIK